MSNAGLSSLSYRLVQRRAQQGNLDKIIEVPSLQGCILSVICETEHLAGLGQQIEIPAQVTDERQAQNGRIRAASAGTELGQLREIG